MSFENPWDIEASPVEVPASDQLMSDERVQYVTSSQDTEEFWLDLGRPQDQLGEGGLDG